VKPRKGCRIGQRKERIYNATLKEEPVKATRSSEDMTLQNFPCYTNG
jgi:hypothetical protein